MSFSSSLRVGIAPFLSSRAGGTMPQQSLRLFSSASQRGFQGAGSRTAVLTARKAAENSSKTGSGRGINWGLLAGAAFATTASTSLATRNTIHCDAASPLDRSSYTSTSSSASEPSPQSIVNVYQLSFGAICGICAGVFIKKGLKFIAFLLGGGFILLQYLNSQRLVSVNWGSISKRYDGFVSSAAGPGGEVKGWQGSTAARLWKRFEDFLTANFQERASLLAGLALGLRLG